MMNTWILQGGHPLVTLAAGTLRQQPFAYAKSSGESAIGSSWLVPVLTRPLKGGPTSRHLLSDKALSVTDELPVVLNAGGSGVFRSRYGAAELEALASHVGELEELERATLLADSWALLLAGQIRWDAFVASARGLGDQDEPNPWGTVAGAVDYAKRALAPEQQTKLAALVRQLFGPQFERLGWDASRSESDLTPQLRAIVLGALAPWVVTNRSAKRRPDALTRTNSTATSRAPSFVSSPQRTDPVTTTRFSSATSSAATPQEEQRYLWGLADFADETLAFNAAERCYNEFRNQDGAIVLGMLSRNATTGPAVWRFFTSRWEETIEKFPANTLSRLALGIPTYIADPVFAEQVADFHESHPLAGESEPSNRRSSACA